MKPSAFAPVSVIIPCYNCKNTIERAVRSVFEQTLKPVELILVDDASKDDTPKTLLRLRDSYGSSWIKVILRNENGGPGASRNIGWNYATQPFITFLDADDCWHKRKIEIQFNWMVGHPDVYMTGHKYTRLKDNRDFFDENLPQRFVVEEIAKKEILLSNRFSTPTVMLRKEIPLRFEETQRYSEDYLLWLLIILEGYKAFFIHLSLTYIFKAPYGEAGLSSNLWQMELGELSNYKNIYKERKITYIYLVILCFWSLIKFLRRRILVAFGNFGRKI